MSTRSLTAAYIPPHRHQAREVRGPKTHEGPAENSKTHRRKAWLYPRQPWGMPKLDQHRNKRGKFFLEIWEIITALSCLYTGFMVPYKLGFTMLYENMLDQRGEKYRCFWHHPAFRTSRWLDLLADVIFIADIVINFVSAHWELRVRPITHWHLVEDLRDISRRYLRGMFTVDLIGSIPLQHLDCIPNVSAPWLKIVRLARLFKLSRLHRIHLFIEGLKQKLPETIYVAFVIELFVFFFLFAHWTGCVFFFVNFGLGLPDAESVERSIINSYLTTEQIESFYDEGWAVKAGLLDETGAATDAGVGWNVWLASLYWAVTTMSTIGYGDISPGTVPERIIGMALMILGCVVFAWMTGSVTNFIVKKSACELRFTDTMEKVQEFMHTRDLPSALRHQIYDYLRVKFPNRRMFDELSILDLIESTALQKEIVLNLFQDVVLSSLFKLCDKKMQTEICFRVKSVFHAPNSTITTAGEEPDAMYIVRFGQVGVTSRHRIRRQFAVGELFGELAILGLSPTGLRVRTSVAQSVVELCKLDRQDFESLLQYPSLFTVVKNAVNAHLANIEVARLEAKQSEPDYSNSQQVDLGADAFAQKAAKFYETIDFIDWADVSKQMQREKALLMSRVQHSLLFDDQQIEQIETATKESLLKTTIVFQFHHLRYRELSWTNAVILCSWKGVPRPGMEATRTACETEVFWRQEITPSDIEDSDTGDSQVFEVPINRHAEIPLVHPTSMSWDDLPPLEIRVVRQTGDLKSVLFRRSMKALNGKDSILPPGSAQKSESPAKDNICVSAQVGHLASGPSCLISGDKEGYVYKRGRVNSGFRKRWFCLHNGVLKYFKESKDTLRKEERGHLSCDGMSVETMPVEYGGDEMKMMYGFVVRDARGRRMECACEEEKHRAAWITSLELAAEQCATSHRMKDANTICSGEISLQDVVNRRVTHDVRVPFRMNLDARSGTCEAGADCSQASLFLSVSVQRHVRHPMWKKLQRNLPSILALSKTMYQQEKQRKLAIAIQASAKSFIDRSTARCLKRLEIPYQSLMGENVSASLPRTPHSTSQKPGSPVTASAAMNEQQSLDMMMAKFESHILQLNLRFDEQAAQMRHMEQNAFCAWKTKFDKQTAQVVKKFERQEEQMKELKMQLAEISNSRDTNAAIETSWSSTASDSNPLAVGVA